jgi:hypothetical protein
MKTTFKNLVISSFLAVSAIMISSCQKDLANAENAQYASVISVSGDGITSIIEANAQSAFVETSVVTDNDLASLLKMKEE